MSKVTFEGGDEDSEDEELRARKAMDSRLQLLQQRHRVKRTKSGGLAGDRERLFSVLEERGAGSILRGWRRELDQDGSLEIGFPDFCRAMSSLGVQIDALRLFQGNDEPQSFKLQDLAPVQALLLSRFRTWVKNNFDGPAGMFTAFDPDQAGFILRDGFIQGCKERSFHCSDDELEELFNCIDFDDGGSVTPDEIVFLELDPQVRDHEIFKLKMRSKFQRQRMLAFAFWEDGCQEVSNKHRRAQRPWLAQDFEKLPPLVCKKRLDKQQELYKSMFRARIYFLRHIRAVYGCEIRAWRRGLDQECRFSLGRKPLRQYCRQHDLAVEFGTLWRSLDKDGDNVISLEELHARKASELARFRKWAQGRYGSCGAVWDLPETVEARERPRVGKWASDKKMLIGYLAEVLKGIGWPSKDTSFLNALDLYGCGFLSLPDLWWLDAWDPPEWLVEEADNNELMELQSLVSASYPQPLNAWRALLDKDSDNLVSWTEFLAACNKIKFNGNCGACWRSLDNDVSGTISLREWDPESAELLSSFKDWCDGNFGSVELAFKAMDKTGIGTLTLHELRSACRRLAWEGDVRMLVTCLGLSASKEGGKVKSLQLSDIAFIDSWIDQNFLNDVMPELKGGKQETEPKKSQPIVPKAPSFMDRPPKASRQRPAMAEDLAPDGEAAERQPPSPQAKLHRMYHCLSSRKKQLPAKQVFRSRSLPWLDKINRIDEYYNNRAAV